MTSIVTPPPSTSLTATSTAVPPDAVDVVDAMVESILPILPNHADPLPSPLPFSSTGVLGIPTHSSTIDSNDEKNGQTTIQPDNDADFDLFGTAQRLQPQLILDEQEHVAEGSTAVEVAVKEVDGGDVTIDVMVRIQPTERTCPSSWK